jgi:hypothetical protein
MAYKYKRIKTQNQNDWTQFRGQEMKRVSFTSLILSFPPRSPIALKREAQRLSFKSNRQNLSTK